MAAARASSTSTWTRSTPPSSSATGRSCAAARDRGRRPAGRPRPRRGRHRLLRGAARSAWAARCPSPRPAALCPHGVYVPARHGEVRGACPRQVMEVLRRFTDCVEPVSIDEAFLDVTAQPRRGPGATPRPRTIAARLKDGDPRGDAAHRLGRRRHLQAGGQDRLRHAQARRPGGGAAGRRGRVPGPAAGAAAVGRGAEDGGGARSGSGSTPSATWPRWTPGALERRLGTHGQDLLRLARGIDDRPVVAEAERGQEHRPGAHLRRGHRATASGCARTLLELARRASPGGCASTACGRARSRSSTATRRFARVTRAETIGAGHRLRRRALRRWPGGCSRGCTARGACACWGSTRRASGAATSSALFAASAPSPADRLRDAVRERFGDGALTRASLLGRRERRHPERRD